MVMIYYMLLRSITTRMEQLQYHYFHTEKLINIYKTSACVSSHLKTQASRLQPLRIKKIWRWRKIYYLSIKDLDDFSCGPRNQRHIMHYWSMQLSVGNLVNIGIVKLTTCSSKIVQNKSDFLLAIPWRLTRHVVTKFYVTVMASTTHSWFSLSWHHAEE